MKRHRNPGLLPLAVLAAALLLCPGPAPAASSEDILGKSRPVVVGGDRDYPPYEFLDADGRPAGYNVDLTRAIAEVMGMKVEFRLGTWSLMRDALKAGRVDILEGMTSSEERLAEVDFAPPHTIVNHAIFARRETPAVASLDELAGKKVIVHRGGIMHDTLARRGWGGDLILTDTPADGLRLLASGQGEYAVVAMLPGMYIIRENKLDNLVPVAKSVATLRYGHAVRKGNDELLSRFSEGLAILKKTGRYEQIYNQWLGVLEDRPIQWQTVAWYAAAVVLPLLALLGGTVLWSHSLRRQVAQRTMSLSQALEELSSNQRQLVQADKMAALGVLVSGVAHEINNPNGLILLNLPILRKAYADAARLLDKRLEEEGDFPLGGIPYSRMRRELPALLEAMQEGAQRIKRIVNDLKDFARRDEAAGKALVDVNDAVARAVRLVENTIRKASDCFSVVYEEDLPMVWGSSQRIEQVAVNLILNACQALSDRTQAIAVSTRHDPEKNAVVITVRDEGRGIAPEHLPRLTDPFFTTKRDSGGTGLGLSVSAGIAKEHGGELTFDSAPGQGAVVTFTLPAAPASPDAKDVEAP